MDHIETAEVAEDLDAALFFELYPALRRFAAVVGAGLQDPDDLVQEAVCRAISLGPLCELNAPSAYLRKTISTLAVNNIRAAQIARRYRSRLVESASSNDSYPSDLDALDLLGPMDRALLYMVDIEGARFVDAAVIVGVSPAAARLRASRARRRLRRHLIGEGQQR